MVKKDERQRYCCNEDGVLEMSLQKVLARYGKTSLMGRRWT